MTMKVNISVKLRLKKLRISRLILIPLLISILLVTSCKNAGNATSTQAASSSTYSSTTQLPEQPPQSQQTTKSSENGSGNKPSAAALSMGGFTTVYTFAQEDYDTAWEADKATVISFTGDSAAITGSGALFSGGTLKIDRAGTYALTGALNNGQILIDAGKNDIVRLIMNGVTVNNELGPAIYAAQSEKLILILADDSVNNISDGYVYKLPDDENEPYAAIYAQDDLSITGNGALNVVGNCKHGIRAQDVLAITGGELNITAAGDALRGRDGVAINGGSMTLTAGGDGIQSNNDTDDTLGFVIIDGGELIILAQSDGIQAESALTINGGTFNIMTGGGSENAPARVEDFRGGWGGQTGESNWQSGDRTRGDQSGNRQPNGNRPSNGLPDSNQSTDGQPNNAPSNVNTSAAADGTTSMKALKAGKQIFINGGVINVDAEDDAVHSNGSILVMEVNLLIKTGDDGLHADEAVLINGGVINISACYEGIEGLSVTINGGEISIVAQDDAINAAGGVDSALPQGRARGVDRFAANGDIFVRISGGSVDLYAQYDGIDANGDIFIEGGDIRISGPSQVMDGAIDLDGNLAITGGQIITAGSIANVSQNSEQPVLLVSYTARQTAGSIITVKNSSGEILLEYTSRIDFTLSGFTSPAFKVGEEYTLLIDGEKRIDVRLSDMVTSIGDDGSAYSADFGRGNRGGWGGGGMPGGAPGSVPGGVPGSIPDGMTGGTSGDTPYRGWRSS